VPHDVHPVALVYRQDLFAQAGIDLAVAKTWPEFQRDCLEFQKYWRAHGYPTRHAVEMHRSKSDELLMMLMQRGINPIDDFNRVHLAEPRVAETVAFYARAISGPGQIASESAGGEGPFARDMQAGDLCVFFAPDWRLRDLKRFGGDELSGKMRLMPMPTFEPTDAPTATWGGTMMAILKTSAHKKEAWELLRQLYFSPRAIEQSMAMDYILPPLPSTWHEVQDEPGDAYFGGQRVDRLLADLARQIPRRYVTPASAVAGIYLVQVLWRATDYLETRGDQGLEPACQKWLDEAAADLQRRAAFMAFD
jgi:ABC-type glycerol-3-phosphate transport system substrate-binding protein